jgi:hypothetical protein
MALASFVLIVNVKSEGKELMLLSALMLTFGVHFANGFYFEFENLTTSQKGLINSSYYLIYLPLLFGFEEMYFQRRSLGRYFVPALLFGLSGFVVLHYLVHTLSSIDLTTIGSVASISLFFTSFILTKRLWILSAEVDGFIVRLFKTVTAMVMLSLMIPVCVNVMPEDNFVLQYFPLLTTSQVVGIIQVVLMSILFARLIALKKFEGTQQSKGKLKGNVANLVFWKERDSQEA